MESIKTQSKSESDSANDAASASAEASTDRSGLSEHRRKELADFLRTRREKIKPEQVGIQQVSRRRTPGLRREEVAEIAGVGTTWYTWLEQARDILPSVDVLRRLSAALQMTSAETRHLYALAGKAAPHERDPKSEVPSESLLNFVNTGVNVPTILLGSRWDILAINDVAEKTLPGLRDAFKATPNWVEFYFGGLERETVKGIGWESSARRVVAEFRGCHSDSIDQPWLIEMVERLSKISADFASIWKEHDIVEIAPTIVEIVVVGELRRFDRTMVQAMEDSRLRMLILSPR